MAPARRRAAATAASGAAARTLIDAQMPESRSNCGELGGLAAAGLAEDDERARGATGGEELVGGGRERKGRGR